MKLFGKKQTDLPGRRMDRGSAVPAQSADIFRRNRTLVGTTSDRLNSANVIKSGLESQRTQTHHLAIRRRRIFGVLMIMLASIVILWLLVSNFTASPLIVVTDKSISKHVDSARYSRVIQDYLGQNPMGRFSFLLDQAALSAYAASRLPEVSLVRLQGMESVGDTNFVITMRKPVAGWVIDNKQYYVDAQGVSFDINYFVNPTVQIVDNSGVPLQTGTTSVSKRLLGYVGRVVAAVRSQGYVVTKATLPASTMRELDINLKDIAPAVKMSIDRPVGEQAEDMSRAVSYFNSHGLTPAYIDVRVSNKAFYK